MQRKIIILIGPSGSGKTLTTSELIDDIDRVGIFDLVKDSQYTKKADGTLRPDIILVEGIEGRKLARLPDKDKFKLVYHPSTYQTLDNGLIASPEFGPFIKTCCEHGNMYIVIDEAHLLCNTWNCPPELMKANLIGRHDAISMILIAQKFTGIHPAIRENADEYYFWKVISTSSLKQIAEVCGDDVAKQVHDLRAVEVDEHNNFVAAGQRLHWTKFKGVVEVTP